MVKKQLSMKYLITDTVKSVRKKGRNAMLVAVRSYSRGYTITTGTLNDYLSKGYSVVMVTPFIKDGNTDYLEYILKKDVEVR